MTSFSSAPIYDRFTGGVIRCLALAVLEPLSMISACQRCEFSPVLNAEFHPLSIHSITRDGLVTEVCTRTKRRDARLSILRASVYRTMRSVCDLSS